MAIHENRYTDGFYSHIGYRFIWQRPDNSLQAAMGQAKIPCASDIFHLLELATDEGWFIIAGMMICHILLLI